MNREQAYATLFAHVSARTPSFRVKSRKLIHWNEVAPADQPALFQTQTAQDPRKVKGQPSAWLLQGEFYLYAHSENVDVTPATLLNNLLDELEAALAPDVLNRQTLGLNFVDDCRLEGQVTTDDGLLGSQVIAIVPYIISTTM